MKQFYTIPIFIPEEACPHRCIYCNQYHIADRDTSPTPLDVKNTIEMYLKTFPDTGIKKIGFFGGNFTGLSMQEQNQYLNIAMPYIESGAIQSIQLSTRPDYISEDILENLKKYKVETIELGAQSLDADVLTFANRGHSLESVQNAASLILSYGFKLGLQMMIGLPKDSFEKSMNTAREIVALGAHCTRIYPTLVIKDTDLELLYYDKKYAPLSMEEAIRWCKELSKYFEEQKITVLRMGLHPSEGLITGKNLVAGPFHVSFKELVMTEIWKDYFIEKIKNRQENILKITVAPKNINFAVGYNATNKKMLLQQFVQVFFKQDVSLVGNECKIEFID